MAVNYVSPYTGITARTAATLDSDGMMFAGVTTDGLGTALRTEFSDLKTALASGDGAGTLTGYDTVVAQYSSTTEIILLAGGQFAANGELFTIATNITLSTATDLTTDDTLTADTWYHVVTNGTTYKLSDAVTCSDVTDGVALRAGVSIYLDTTLKIRPYDYDGKWYRYRSEIPVFSGTAPTTLTALDLSAYGPESISGGYLVVSSGALSTSVYELTISLDGAVGEVVMRTYSARIHLSYNGPLRRVGGWQFSSAQTLNITLQGVTI